MTTNKLSRVDSIPGHADAVPVRNKQGHASVQWIDWISEHVVNDRRSCLAKLDDPAELARLVTDSRIQSPRTVS